MGKILIVLDNDFPFLPFCARTKCGEEVTEQFDAEISLNDSRVELAPFFSFGFILFASSRVTFHCNCNCSANSFNYLLLLRVASLNRRHNVGDMRPSRAVVVINIACVLRALKNAHLSVKFIWPNGISGIDAVFDLYRQLKIDGKFKQRWRSRNDSRR